MAKKVSQKDRVLAWLVEFGDLTTREAVTELNIMCLAKRVEELRKEGYSILLEYRKSSTGARYGVYSLNEEVSPENIAFC